MKIYEYRGVEGLVYAPVLTDTSEGYTTGTVKPLAGVAEISKATDSNNEPHYYDNIPAVVVSSTGSDELTINTSAIPLDTLADITGQEYDATTGMFTEQERKPGYFAIGYQTKDTDGNVYYVWRLKGTFAIPDQDNATENDGTDANGQELTFTGISTTHKFAKYGKPAKAITVNTGLELADVTNFFNAVQTPDSIVPLVPPVVTGIGVAPSAVSVEEGKTVALTATLYPAGATGVITWEVTEGGSYASVNANGVVSGTAEGNAVVTATCGTYSDTCTVTVTAPSA